MRCLSIVRNWDCSAAKGAESDGRKAKSISGRPFRANARPLAALELNSGKIAQDGFVAAREGTNEEMREEAQHGKVGRKPPHSKVHQE
jgi:hypothetical protein